jgi:regulator of protease activity HflC (stomatin/prohibitin superfamily)
MPDNVIDIKAPSGKKVLMIVVLVVTVILLLSLLGLSAINVPAGHKAVVISGLGEIGSQYDEGFQLKNPFVQVEYVRWNTQYMEETISVLTSDEYNVPVDFQVVYHLEEERVGDIRVDNPDYKFTVIRNVLRSEVRKTAADMNLTGNMINTKRTAFESQVEQRVKEKCDDYYIAIESVNIRNIDLPNQILDAAEKRASAKIDIETASYELEAERARAQKEQVKAQAEANATIILAEGQAESISILAEVSQEMTSEMMEYILSLRYIAALRDPDSNVQFVVVPMEGTPLILDLSGLEAQAAQNATT